MLSRIGCARDCQYTVGILLHLASWRDCNSDRRLKVRNDIFHEIGLGVGKTTADEEK
jgi:hypothetical protein